MEQAGVKISQKEHRALRLPLKAIAFGGCLGAIIFFSLLALLAVFLPSTGIKSAWLPYITVLAGGLSSFFAAFVVAKAKGEKGLLLGLCCAVLEGALLSLALLLAAKGIGVGALFLFAALLGCGGAGGVFGVNASGA
ncbi:MAG: TIGR04086 family membrane protein [Clostridium sp.]|jgi:putative membrane protein (TIGR04086 family)|nr:TIGR04086 family membrane protein [Clostridium sp.]